MKQTYKISAVFAAITLAAAAFSGCAADATGNSGASINEPMGEGSFNAKIDKSDFTVDYTGYTAKVEMAHRLNPAGIACVGQAKVTIAGENEQCKLVLEFSPDFTGAMTLQKAEFHAKVAIYQDDFPIDSYECPGWTDESKYAKGHLPVVYELSGGEATLAVKPLAQPEAGQASAVLAGYKIAPKGTVKMKFKGRSFDLDLSGIKVVGDVQSKGSKSVSCSQEYLPLPEISLKDINPKSPTFGEELDMSTAFQGKFVSLHLGAGWCASCVSQVEYMQKIKADLESAGREDFVMVSINDVSAADPSNQKTALGKKGEATFPVLQATGSEGWANFVDCNGMKGKKNDGFTFAPDGRFIRKHEGKGTVYMNVWEDDVRAGLGTKVEELEGCECTEIKDSPKKVHHIACK